MTTTTTSAAPAVLAALLDVMRDVPAVAKSDRNETQGFSFRGIDSVLTAVGPALRRRGVVVAPVAVTADYQPITLASGKTATSCRVTVTYRWTAAADGSHIDTLVAGEAMDLGDKATPKALSVAFRTALLQVLALPTDEPDPDQAHYERAPELAPWVAKFVNAGHDAGLDDAALRALIRRATDARASLPQHLHDRDRPALLAAFQEVLDQQHHHDHDIERT